MNPTERALRAVAGQRRLTLLERLRLAKQSLSENPWDFEYWNTCTCGHIYAGAHGGELASVQQTITRASRADDAYRELLRVIAEANEIVHPAYTNVGSAMLAGISNYTYKLARKRAKKGRRYEPGDRAMKAAARAIIERAIEQVETQYDEARRVVAG